MTAMNGSPPPSTGSCFADTDEHHRYFLNSADLIHRILQQLDGRPVSSIQIVTREGSTSTSVSYPLAASVPSLAVLSSPLEAPSGSALISLAAAPASPAAPTPTPAARSSPVAAPPKDAFLTAPSCSELQISPDPSPSISPESSLYTTGVHHRSDYAAWTPSSTDAATSHLKTPLRRRGIPDSLGPWLQWRYVSPESLALPCSNKKLKLGESLSWKETSVEPAPVCKVFGRIDEENTPDSFCKVLCTSELEVISIPSRVLPWFYGGCPESINLKMSTACTWIVDLKQQDGNVLMDKGWPEFVKAHDLKVGYLLTFKKLDTKSLQVLIFGYNCCEKVIWCSGYHPSLGQQYQSQLY
ncbi:hypothetical protein QYE76_018938 [Lolium multiflorum]|uniref:TF-B3 domain-containing protein n=1 Tax=Lolium multiflorum TaxID=4521 RepID=A0AAD8V8U2_LOLMU|nr:hypothetical protein QYE76_018938 [Lolium multiflorum]